MRVDLHNHTTLCNHAEGELFQYIEEAIKRKIDFFGVTDHAPMNFDKTYRMSFDQIGEYFNLIEEVQKKYRGKIEILKGFEVDYLPNFHDPRVLEAPVDYLIGSIHFLQGWGFDNPEFIGRYESENIDQLWELYFKEVENMVESNLFQIVGHLDLMKVFKFFPKEKKIDDFVEPVLKKIAKSKMAIEINGSGYRKPIGEPYPSISILKRIYDYRIPITFSSDAHSPSAVGVYLEELEREARNIGFKEVAIFKNRELELVKF
jgi:histidinol-phosphatase (PHP family)